MSDHKNVIELNGKLYDSVSGHMVGNKGNAGPTVIKPGTAVDGFVRSAPVKEPKAHHTQTAPKPIHVQAPTHHNKAHKAAKSIAAHTQHHSKTLVRRGLKKPIAERPEESEVYTKGTPQPERLARAKSTPQSPHISRFGLPSAATFQVTKKTTHMPVKHSPNQLKARAAIQQASVPIASQNQILKEQMVSKALNDARVDEVPHKKAKKHNTARRLGVSPKVVHFGAATLAAVLLFGFIAYQNAPNISMKIAASKAGISAVLPSYKPAGFGLSGPIEYGPGQITLNFKSHTDNRNFHITQRASDWNSEALLSNFVSTNSKSYQTVQDKGRTIYIYDGTNATWVSGGVWYQIEGNSSLSSEQLVKLAGSI